MSARTAIRAFEQLRSRFGAARAVKHAMFRAVNRVLYLDCLHIIALDREDLRPLDTGKAQGLRVRIATLDDLKDMQRQGCWEINPTKIGYFHQGDVCLLSYIGQRLAGYTWAHANGCPELVPGLRLRVPNEYLYNYAGFTLPEFRGYGLQPFRHHALLNDPRWRDKRGLMGFVIHTNYSSRKGQGKSGYRRIGDIWLLGTKSNFYAHIGPPLRSVGIERLGDISPQTPGTVCP